jgi:hypothetical protein
VFGKVHIIVLFAMIINSIAFLIYKRVIDPEDLPNFQVALFLTIGLLIIPIIHYLIGRKFILASIYY